jgi:hypothetical protein
MSAQWFSIISNPQKSRPKAARELLMRDTTVEPTLKSLTLHDGRVKQNCRILLDDLSGRQIEYTVRPCAIRNITQYQPYHGLKYISVIAAVIECVQRLTREWRESCANENEAVLLGSSKSQQSYAQMIGRIKRNGRDGV